MKRIALPLTILIMLLWAALQPTDVLTFSAAFMPMRKALTLLSGALALGWMGFCMLLALRPAWLERSLGGLDKLYHVHKWAGITAVLLVVAHWLLILSPRTLASWGWIETVARGRHGPGGGGSSLIGLAKEMGEWSAWIMIVLGIVALLRFVPYGWFRKLHKGFPVAFLIGAFHSVVMLQKENVVATPFGLMLIAVSLIGSVIAVVSLYGVIGRNRRHRGQIASVVETESGVLDLRVDPGADWPGHEAGQFALLTVDRSEGPHPFTIVSDWKPGASLRFDSENSIRDAVYSAEFRQLATDTSTITSMIAFAFGTPINVVPGVATFTGKVVIVQGQMRLAADRVTVTYAQGDKRRISAMHAEGNVTMVSGEDAAESRAADYDVESGNVVLTGDVLMTQTGNVVAGEKVVVNLATGTAQASGRVRSVLQPGTN